MFSQTATTFTRSGLLFMPNWLRLCSNRGKRLGYWRAVLATLYPVLAHLLRWTESTVVTSHAPVLVLYILGIEPSYTSIKTGWHSNASSMYTTAVTRGSHSTALRQLHSDRHHLPGLFNANSSRRVYTQITHNLHSRREYRT